MVGLLFQSQYARALTNNHHHLRGSPFQKTVRDISNSLPKEEFNKHVLELQKELRSQRRNISHINMLVKGTYFNRKQWLPMLLTGRLAPILEKFHGFEEGNYVSNQMKFMHTAVALLAVWLVRISCLI